PAFSPLSLHDALPISGDCCLGGDSGDEGDSPDHSYTHQPYDVQRAKSADSAIVSDVPHGDPRQCCNEEFVATYCVEGIRNSSLQDRKSTRLNSSHVKI